MRRFSLRIPVDQLGPGLIEPMSWRSRPARVLPAKP